MPFFTVFTPTYNRAHTLHRVYESLLEQTFQDFEWLVVDDGSTDHTRSLIAGWNKTSLFPIRYVHQSNQGKHVAMNMGVGKAKGEMFLVFDSDDRCSRDALERLHHAWQAIPAEEKPGFSTVAGLCTDAQGRVLGTPYPSRMIDIASPGDQFEMRASGERWGANRTSVLRAFPFPEIRGETFIPEAIVWNRIARRYKTRFINEKLRRYIPQTGGLSTHSTSIRVHNPVGTSLYYRELMHLDISLKNRIKAIVNYVRFSLHAHEPVNSIVAQSDKPVATFLLFMAGYALHVFDAMRPSRPR